MSELTREIQMAQILAGEAVVINRLKKLGLIKDEEIPNVPNSEPNAQVSDTTEAESSNADD